MSDEEERKLSTDSDELRRLLADALDTTGVEDGFEKSGDHGDIYRTRLKMYVPKVGVTIYHYTKKLAEHLHDKTEAEKIKILRSRLTQNTIEVVEAGMIPDDSEITYDRYVDLISQIIDKTTITDIEKKEEEMRQQEDEDIWRFWVRYNDTRYVLDKMRERDEQDYGTTSRLRRFIEKLQPQERTITEDFYEEKMEDREFLVKCREKIGRFKRIVIERKEKPTVGVTEKRMKEILEEHMDRVRKEKQINHVNTEEKKKSKKKRKKDKPRKDKKKRRKRREDSPETEETSSSEDEEGLNYMGGRYQGNDRSQSDSRFGKRERDYERGDRDHRHRDRNYDNRNRNYEHKNREEGRYSKREDRHDRYPQGNRRDYTGNDRGRYGSRNDQHRSGFGDRDRNWNDRDRNRRGSHNSYSSYSDRSKSPFSDSSRTSRDRDRSASRSPSGDRFMNACWYCQKPHRALKCPHLFVWIKETMIWAMVRKIQKTRDLEVGEIERIRTMYGVEEEKCTNNPARDREGGYLKGDGPYCRFCHSKEHPTMFCPKHCPLCDTKNADHGWRDCKKHEEKAKQIDTEFASHLDKEYHRWRGITRPQL